MIKKLILGTLLIMFLGLATGCLEGNLNKHKTNAKTEIQAYALEIKLKNEYTSPMDIMIENIITQGRISIDDADSKIAVDNLIITVKLAIDNVPHKAEMIKIIGQFDLTDPKIIWNGSSADEFCDDMIIVILRKSFTFPALQIKHFGLINIISLEYIGEPPLKEHDIYLENYHQIVYLHIKPQGKMAVIEAIRQLEKQDFIKSASPNSINTGN